VRSPANKLLPLALALLFSSLLLPATAPLVVPPPLSTAEIGADHHSAYDENTFAPGHPHGADLVAEALLEEKEERNFSLTGTDSCILPTDFHLLTATRQHSTRKDRLYTRRLTADHSPPLFLVTARIRI